MSFATPPGLRSVSLSRLFDISQPPKRSPSLKKPAAGLGGCRDVSGLLAYYYVIPDAKKELSEWLS